MSHLKQSQPKKEGDSKFLWMIQSCQPIKKILRIKVLDREFAARVTEKGLASKQEVAIAQRVQEEEFEKENRLKILLIRFQILKKELNAQLSTSKK